MKNSETTRTMRIIREHLHSNKKDDLGYAGGPHDLAEMVFSILEDNDHFTQVGRKIYNEADVVWDEAGESLVVLEAVVDLDDPKTAYSPIPHDYRYYME